MIVLAAPPPCICQKLSGSPHDAQAIPTVPATALNSDTPMAIHQRLDNGLPLGKTRPPVGTNARVAHQTPASTHDPG